jgi:2-polyprenyl-3-methyl-5-hydroxy-6-metoxy-1,4-benzoquinol methylase
MSQQTESCSIPCNLCGGKDIAILSNMSRSGKPLRTVICKSCGLVWSDPRPHDARQFYEEEYRVAYKHTYAPKPKHVLRAGHVALSRLDKIKPLLSGSKTILDVGTGGGEFAYLLQSRGHTVSGVEPNRGYADYSINEYGLPVQVGFVQDGTFPPDAFDVITMWHVLEHTENPEAVLVRLRSWLKPDGILVVEVPNVEATCQSPRSTFHEAHLYNFNIATLRGLAEKSELHEAWHTISSDGGNITMFLKRKGSLASDSGGSAIPGNFQRVCAVVGRHTNFRHSLTRTPYLRAWQRLRRALSERTGTAHFRSGKHLLDSLYTRAAAIETTSSLECKGLVQ